MNVSPNRKKSIHSAFHYTLFRLCTQSCLDFFLNIFVRGIARGFTGQLASAGATYIDHNTRTVLNGSRLGKEFSANALENWFNHPEDKPIIQTQGNTKDNSTTPDNSRHQSHGERSHSGGTASDDQSNRHGQTAQSSPVQSHPHGYDDTSMFDGLGGLFSVGPAFDAQEEAFYREMQRRKKKKRRGSKL